MNHRHNPTFITGLTPGFFTNREKITTDHDRDTILADFRDWSGGFEPEETTIEERCDYAKNAASTKHTNTELYEVLGVPRILGSPIR